MKRRWLSKRGKGTIGRDVPVIYNVDDVIIFLAMNFVEFE